MRKYKRILTFLLSLVMILNFVPVMSVAGMTADETLYTTMFSVKASAFYMTCQPSSAIILTDQIQLTPSKLSPNYTGGVVDLPRLQADYHYQLSSENSNYFLGNTLYPTLCWNTDAVGTETHLSICSEKTGAVLCTVVVAIGSELATTMKGIDFHYLVEYDEIQPDGSAVKKQKVEFHDTSENVVVDLVNAGANMRHYSFPAGSFSIYDAEMHKRCIVMDKYAYTPDIDTYSRMSDFDSHYTYEDFDKNAYKFNQHEGASNTVEFNIKEHLGTLNSSTRSGLLFYGSKTKDCTFDVNKGIAKTVTDIKDTDALYYFIALSDKCYFSKVDDGVAADELNKTYDGAPILSWAADRKYSLQSGVEWLDAGFTGNPSVSNANYLNYGPVSFDSFSESISKYNLQITDDNYSYMHNNTTETSDINLYATSLIYAASIPHLGTLALKPARDTITVNYYYKNPDLDNWVLLGSPVTYNAAEFSSVTLEKLPDIANYTADCWYADPNLTTKVDLSSYSKTQTQVISLYGNYVYNGDYYNVTYYDDYNKTNVTEQYRIVDKPKLPTTPTGASGTGFSHYIIVNNKDDTTGVTYNPETFTPVPNGNYLFKTVWVTKGIITSVTLDKKDYFLGEAIDLDKVHVFVTKDDSSESVEVKSTEYSLDNSYVLTKGSNLITVTLAETGSQFTFEVNGVSRQLSSLSAQYTGGSVKVGDSINPSAFKVTLQYTDGSESTTDDFTLSPTTVTRVGRNTITVEYLGLTTACVVDGIDAEEYKHKANLTSIKAKYGGKKLYVNSKVNASDLVVVANYEDGSKVTLAKTDFTYSPDKFNKAGDANIVCTYEGLSASASVKVYEKTSAQKPEKPNSPSKPSSPGESTSPSKPNSSTGGTSSTGPSSSTGGTNGISGTGSSSSSGQGNQSYTDPSTSVPNYETETNNPTMPPVTNPNITNGSESEATSDSKEDVENQHSNTGKKDKGTSKGYLLGANILTNVALSSGASTMGTLDITNAIDNANDNENIYVKLVNGYSGNQITTEQLNLMHDKHLTCFISLLDAVDQQSTVAEWVIKGDELETTSFTINPNIIFENTAIEGKTLVYFATSQGSYPLGISLSVIPPTRYYSPGELLRLYSCSADYSNASLLRAVTWSESNNLFTVDVTSASSYCLSNAVNPVPEGGSLTDDENVVTDDVTAEAGDENTDFDFGDDTGGQSDTPAKDSKGILKILLIVAAVLMGISVIGCVTLFIVTHRPAKIKNLPTDTNTGVVEDLSDTTEDSSGLDTATDEEVTDTTNSNS